MSVYQSLGGASTVVAIVVSIIVTWVFSWYYFRRGKITKALGWTPLRITQIVVRPVTDVAKGLALTWNSQDLLTTPYVVKIRIKNVGSREVIAPRPGSEKSDYIQPLIVEFKSSKCYEATISEAFNTVLDTPTAIRFEPADRFEVPMPTLNMSAWVDVTMIADGEPEFPRLSCHLEGQTAAIQPVPGRYRKRTKVAAMIGGSLGLFLATLGFGLLGLYSYTSNGGGYWPPVLLTAGILLAVAAVLVYLIAWFLDLDDWNKVKRVAPELFESRRPRMKIKSPHQ